MCAVTRRPLPADDLLRFVAAPDGTLAPDIRRRLPGRGVNIALSAAAVREAIRRKTFERSLGRPVTVPPALAEETGRLLRQDALNWLALANKAGLVTAGFAKVEACLAAGGALALLSASDGAAEGQRKLVAAARRGGRPEGGSLPVISFFSSNDFQLALGRELVIHAALLPGPAAEEFLVRGRRLARYESDPMPPMAAKAPATDHALPESAQPPGLKAE
jgi:predicted RNA-binding protein YlxR (DUF448 family)